MPYPELKGLLTDIGVEELGHLEMIGTMVHQLTRNLTEDEIEKNPNFMAYFVDHTAGVYPTAASGSPWNAASIASTGDTIGDLNENLAAEQKARVTYDNILRLVDDPDIIETDLSKGELMGLVSKAGTCVFNIHQTSVPFDGTWDYANIWGNSVIKINTEKNKDKLIDYIYNLSSADIKAQEKSDE